AKAQHRRRRGREDELDGERADDVAGERGAVEREGAANLVAQQQEAVERRVARRHGRVGYGEERGGHGGMPPWRDVWLTASTASVRELTPSVRSTAATWSLTVSTERLSSR